MADLSFIRLHIALDANNNAAIWVQPQEISWFAERPKVDRAGRLEIPLELAGSMVQIKGDTSATEVLEVPEQIIEKLVRIEQEE